jgi:homoserine kinase
LHDRLHQPFRKDLVPGLQDLLGLEHPDLLGVCLSGAGPSIVALAERNLDEIERLLRAAFAVQNLPFTIRRLAAHQSDSTAGSQLLHESVASLPNSHS